MKNKIKNIKKAHEPQKTEKKIYKIWEKSGYFNPDKLPGERKNVFSIVLPPPNVTGILHMGHAVTLTIEDIMVRYHRMKGEKTLWLPGTDHAAIATQTKVEKLIFEKEKKTRHDLGKKEFLKRIKDFVKESRKTITDQTKRIGASLDWSREAFTLDEKRSLAVKNAFLRLYEKGLIYRGSRIVNWCPKCLSTLSDDEVEYKPTKAKLYTFKYSKTFPIAIATTRPETKLGDTGVAVHPEDKRYKKYIGKSFVVRLTDRPQKIKVVADKTVDPRFGTGAVGLTPAHSFIDYEIAQNNGLPLKKVIGEDGKMTPEAGRQYQGLHVKKAREKFVKWLEREKLMIKEEETDQNLSVCYRCGQTLEPLPSLQWFINVNKKFPLKSPKLKRFKPGQKTTLKELMKKTVQSGQIELIPERFKKNYFNWINNLKDWCISRQIWYGHQIPVFYCSGKTRNKNLNPKDKKGNNSGFVVSLKKPKVCPICKKCDMTQDPDTLDTWFSSALWTFSTLGWPRKTKDLTTFHPTSILETGYDILFFWVARMILMSTCLLEEIPFKRVYLHGLIRDEKGRKMSKSLGNVIDPLGVIEKFGADALRMALVVGSPPGKDTNIWEEKIKGYKHFANKLWNVARFITLNSDDSEDSYQKNVLTKKDKDYLKELNLLVKDLTKKMDQCKFYLVGERLYHYIWHTVADKLLEESKPILRGNKKKEKTSRQRLLFEILKTVLIMLHPFMPFVTEEIWQIISPPAGGRKNLLIIQSWPDVS
jgi:valyl-tRNA synthetase